MKVQTRSIKKQDYKQAHKFQCRYLDEESFKEFLKRVKGKDKIYLGAFDGNKVIGIAYGHPSEYLKNSFLLQGIAVELDPKQGYARTGIGSKLLEEFEKRVKKKGWKLIDVGSADDPKVEKFYLKNRFKPYEIKAKNKKGDLIEMTKVKGFKEGLKKREKLRKKHKPYEVIFIFQKRLR